MKASFPLPDIVLKDLHAPNAETALQQLAITLEHSEGVDADMLQTALLKAENTGGSTIGGGVAVVATRMPRLSCPRRICAFATLARPVTFKGTQDHACDTVFILVSPDHEIQEHLRDLSSVIRTLRDDDFIDRLRTAETGERVAGLFRARDMAIAKAA